MLLAHHGIHELWGGVSLQWSANICLFQSSREVPKILTAQLWRIFKITSSGIIYFVIFIDYD